MAASSKIPLYLFQVLEEEYAALHGESPWNGKPVILSDPTDEDIVRRVVPTPDWSFHATHIRDERAFIAELVERETQQLPLAPRPASLFKRLRDSVVRFGKRIVSVGRRTGDQPKPPAEEDPDKLAKDKLKDYLCAQLDSNKNSDKTLSEALNDILDRSDLFREDRFSNYWLNNATRGMRDVHTAVTIVPVPSRFAAGPLTGDDLKHFNRLLLEDAFPEHLEQIHRIRLAAIYQRIHEKKHAAICLSGGGIRSGTFALGVLQGLARHKLLDKFHYLSTVSGGGYIGSWLSAWIRRHRDGLDGVTAELANTTPRTKVDPDPDPIRYLRRYSSFITPKVGLLSADTWTFIGIYLRNLVLNWSVFIPLLLGVLTLPRLIVSLTIAPTTQTEPLFFIPSPGGSLAVFGRHLFLAAGFVLTVWALAYIMFNRPTVREELRQASRFWRRRATQKWFLLCCLLPLSLAALCLTTYWAWSSQSSQLPKKWWHFFLFGLAATVFAWVVSSVVLRTFRIRRLIQNRNLVYLVVAGLAGGLLLWFITATFDPFGGRGLWDCLSVANNWSLQTWTAEIYACLAVPAFLLVFLLGTTVYIAVTSKSTSVDDEDREWWSRLGAWVLIVILGWTILTVIVIFGPLALRSAPAYLAPLGGISGVLAAIAGRSAKTPGTPKSSRQESSVVSGILNAVMSKALPLLATIFIVTLLVSLSLATTGIYQLLAQSLPGFVSRYPSHPTLAIHNYLNCIYFVVPGKEPWVRANLAHMALLHLTSFWFVLSLGVLLFVLGAGISGAMNLNIFSLHAGYRNRLIRAFLGASRPDHERKPNPFTGFDPSDNMSMHELRPGLFDEKDFPEAVALSNALLQNTYAGDFNGNKNLATALSQYLRDNDFLNNLNSVPDKGCFSIRLLAGLRKDFNAALQDPSLHKNLSQLNSTENGSAKRSSHIASNRAIFEEAFGRWIKPAKLSECYRLMPVINTTLNLVGGDNLAWQQRKAEPFSVSPLYSGCFRLGYRDSRVYGGGDTGGISIGTAAAISGAAASSNMGYYTTSPVLSLVLTFFNVRLGWWLGNPGIAGNKTFGSRAPRSSVKPVLDEAFGFTDDENKYVYLTDGGHFENLGLYEMVLRRCHTIIVSDAAADGDYRFGDLGNAIRKVRIDLGIPIEFTAMPIFSLEPGETRKGMYWAVGRIRYSCIDGAVKDGVLLYVKPAVYGNEPGDVLEYKKSHPAFPHQSTADQFFDEPQFESYRILGSHIMDQLCGPKDNELSLAEVLENAVEMLLDTQDGGPADPRLKKWWEELHPPSLEAQCNRFLSSLSN